MKACNFTKNEHLQRHIFKDFAKIFSYFFSYFENQEQLFFRNTFQWLLLKNCKANQLTGSYTMRVFTEWYFRIDYNTEAAAGGALQK